MRFALAAVWLGHGLYNKLLGGSPRHLAIVQSVPGLEGEAGRVMLIAVGIVEVGFAIWLISGRAARTCAATQTVMLLVMNVAELTYARHLLLWPAGLVPLNLCFLALVWLTALGGPAWLRRHPLAIRTTLHDCITLTYALPAAVLRPMLPPGLELETVGDDGFVAVAIVQARRLRPAGVPAAMGQDFFLAGYRIFTRFRKAEGRSLRGLRILRSDTDRRLMQIGGNLLTHYNYHRCDAAVMASGQEIDVAVRSRDGADLEMTAHLDRASLPAESPFASLREARRFAGPLPFTFDYEPETHSIVSIRASRANWMPQPIAVDVRRVGFFDLPPFRGCTPRLAAAFHVADVDYRWERGVLHAL